MAGDGETRFGVLAGLVACMLMLALTVMAFSPNVAPPVFQAISLPPVAHVLKLPDAEQTPSFEIHDAV